MDFLRDRHESEQALCSQFCPLLQVMAVGGVRGSIQGGKPMRWKAVVAIIVSLIFTLTVPAPGISQSENGQSHAGVLIPESTIEHPEDVGLRAHTNHLIKFDGKSHHGGSPSGETPTSLRSVYKLPSTGGAGVIAIVDAFDYPTAENDLNVFSTQFGLPACTAANGCFKKVFASGSQPAVNCGWSQEAALDIEWAHAMAPNAKIVLVEAATNSFVDLFAAVDVATSQVLATGGRGEVSMSWGGGEFSTEASNDSHFQHDAVVYFAASGDTGGANIYPSVSPFVVSSGSTRLNLRRSRIRFRYGCRERLRIQREVATPKTGDLN